VEDFRAYSIVEGKRVSMRFGCSNRLNFSPCLCVSVRAKSRARRKLVARELAATPVSRLEVKHAHRGETWSGKQCEKRVITPR
jgi:hypothetical protein